DFLPEDNRPGSERVVILSAGLWRSRYGGTRAVLGQRIMLNEQPHTIVGVVSSDPWLCPEISKVYVPAVFVGTSSSQARSNYSAPGARSTTILGLFLMKAMRLLLVAFPLGLTMSWVLTCWMSALLFGVGPAEPKVLIPTGLFLFGTVLLAALWP